MVGLSHRLPRVEVRRSNFLRGVVAATVGAFCSPRGINVMALETTTAARPAVASDRYRQAEMALWDHYGLRPTERYVDIPDPAVRLRVVELGAGSPILFFPGTLVTGPAWAALVRELAGHRCLLVDRPGQGLSSAVDFLPGGYGATVSRTVEGLFDGLGVKRATVVGHSIGAVWALRAALAMPSRVQRVVLLGSGPVVGELEVPDFIARIASPLGAIITRLPLSPGRARSIMRDSGHGATLDAGGVPDELANWMAAFANETRSMSNERSTVRMIVRKGGWRPGLTFDDRELASIDAPVSWIVGEADPIGSIELWKRTATRMPRAEVTVISAAGHLPWLDDARSVAEIIRSGADQDRAEAMP
jgi:pimeloyl-ACP methyl ester carboxylesterase